jgi:hypothetical protein
MNRDLRISVNDCLRDKNLKLHLAHRQASSILDQFQQFGCGGSYLSDDLGLVLRVGISTTPPQLLQDLLPCR